MNLTGLLDESAARWPEKPAIIEGDFAISYKALQTRVSDFASKLQQIQFSPSCRIGLCYPNSIDYVALTFALWRLNVVVVPIPTESTEEDFLTIAASMELEGILSQKPLGNSISIEENCFFTRAEPSTPANNHGLNIAFIRFTSGTTNTRKGVVLCHETIRDRIVAANKALRICADDRVMWCLPMSHHFLITIVLYLSQGATIVMARHVLARSFLEAINRWQGTVLYAAPFHYAMLARDNSNLGIPSVRLAVSTTCALPEDVARDFQKRFIQPLVQGLGIIELGLVTLNNADPSARWNSVGRPLPDFQVRIMSPDEDGSGEVAVRGPGLLDAYASPWMPREKILRDSWFITGDIGRFDADGFLFLSGRKTAVINVAGRKVFPEEIEAVLNRHPAVRESRAYGRLHSHLGEIIEAELVLAKPGTNLDTVRDFCRSHLASFKIPSSLHVVNSLPRTAVTGKIRRVTAVA
jgi:Acyl-CoA synthetases (AMP-forming)/AMP-acid ligases II